MLKINSVLVPKVAPEQLSVQSNVKSAPGSCTKFVEVDVPVKEEVDVYVV